VLAVAEPYGESFGFRIPDEVLAIEQLSCRAEAKVLIEEYRQAATPAGPARR